MVGHTFHVIQSYTSLVLPTQEYEVDEMGTELIWESLMWNLGKPERLW